MKVRNEEHSNFDRGGTLAPWQFYGSGAPNTDKSFTDAPVLSLYWDVTGGVLYVKTASTFAAADWKALITTAGGQTIAGSLTVSSSLTVNSDLTVQGTVTAGDIVAA